MALRTAGSVLVVFLWSVAVVLGQDGWSVKYTTQRICVLKESTVELTCSYTYPSGYTITTTFWFTKMEAGKEPKDLGQDPEYAGRLEYHEDKKKDCTLRITDLRESDSVTYKFRFITDQEGGKYTGNPGVTLSVTALQVKLTYSSWPNWVTITCSTTCTLSNPKPTYIWYKNGQHLHESTSPQYKYSVYSNSKDRYSCAVKGHEDLRSPAVCVQGQSCNRVTYTKRRICALKGSTVDISCTYDSGYYTVKSSLWFSPKQRSRWRDKLTPEDLTRDPGYAGRVEYPDKERWRYTGHSSLRISDLREEDSAEYRFTFKTDNFDWGHSFPGTTLSVTGLQVKVTPAAEGQKTLTCITTCTLTDNPTYIWYKNGQRLDEPTSQQHFSNMLVVWDSTVDIYSCAVEGHEALHSPVVCFQVKVTPKQYSTYKTLTCSTTCILTGNPTYTWYKNGQVETVTTSTYSVLPNAKDSYSCAVKGQEDLHSPAVCVQGQSCYSVTYTKRRICVLKESTVDISCTVGYYSTTSSLWFRSDKSTPEDLTTDPGYAGRVEYTGTYRGPSSLRITDLREEDSAEYRFTFKTHSFDWGHSFPGTTLSVTGLQVKVTPAAEGQKTLTCITTCTLTDNPTYIWYKNGQCLDEPTSQQYSSNTLVVLGHSVDSYSCAVEHHEDLHSPAVCVQGQSCNRVTYTKRRICVLKGSTVDISCTYVGYYSTTSSFWFRSDKSTPEDLTRDPGYAGRVEYTGTYRGPFSLRITDLREEDSAEYRFTFKTNNIEWGHSFPGTTLSVTGLQVKVTPAAEGQKTLTCITTCTLTDNPTYIWYKNGQRLDEPTSQQHSSNMLVVWDSSVNRYSCAVEGHEALHSPVVCFQVKVTPKQYSMYKTLTCSTTCILTGNPTYTWYKNGQHLDESTSPQYKDPVSSNYEDSYSCAVKGHEDLLSPAVCVQGQRCNRVTYTKRRICVLKGSTVDISCTYVGYYSTTSSFWFRSDRLTPEDLTTDPGYAGRVKYTDKETWRNEGPSILRITDLREEDSAEYRFTFKTYYIDWGHSFPGTTLSVTGLQVKVTPAAEGQKTLTCITTCTLTDNPTYIWYRNRQPIKEDSSPMYSISSEDADSYFCAVKGRLSSPAVYKPKTSVSVSPSGEIVEGSSVTLTCSSDANPPVQSYTWWYKKNGDDYQSMTGPQHVFNQIQSSDTGEYYCVSQNEMGTDRSRTINMDVKYKPKNTSLSVSPSDEIVEGSSVTLTCSSDANPPVDKYTWYKKNVTSPKASGQSYSITNIISEDRGEYYCEAENKYGRLNSSSVSVDVQYGPKNTSVSVSPSGEIVEGSSVTLTCSSDANPPVDKYTWYFQNETFLNGCGQMYNISNFKSKDSGHYHCEAWNRRGSRNSTAVMIILPGKQTSVVTAAVGIIVVVLVLILCLSGLMWFRKKASISTSDTRDISENVQGDSSPVYENVSSMSTAPTAAQTVATVDPDDVHYASVHFSRSKNQEVPLYSTVQVPQPQKEDEYVQYDAVKFNLPSAATQPTAAQAAEEESSVLYSTVN
ncbi:hemicentin-2-like isoform X2 [Oncorhynchus mykiss]|uniref:hemicentin-2-like isoform X2 n=1 Tax=Oncorhynchus mykiss TaxID=8022 RepID=UPI001878270B|nr:hemicentin-2-like isoform X2 [Oncorhynchus mykiss]XP_036804957.1 hemicentin-2-like isoform X2 [Oncorhynchus mykiss]XP_036804958.1 hemicentin-2-like isoform X2 [Oncorhynchus mykiss]